LRNTDTLVNWWILAVDSGTFIVVVCVDELWAVCFPLVGWVNPGYISPRFPISSNFLHTDDCCCWSCRWSSNIQWSILELNLNCDFDLLWIEGYDLWHQCCLEKKVVLLSPGHSRSQVHLHQNFLLDISSGSAWMDYLSYSLYKWIYFKQKRSSVSCFSGDISKHIFLSFNCIAFATKFVSN
jgi:hypothetical protein